MWKNKNARKCSSGECGCSVMIYHYTNDKIPDGMVEYTTTRYLPNGNNRRNSMGGIGGFYLKVPEYGKVMTQLEADKLDMESGRSVPSGRNTVSFVMSRAAKKRGIKSPSYSYNADSKIELNGKTVRQNRIEWQKEQFEKWLRIQARKEKNETEFELMFVH